MCIIVSILYARILQGGIMEIRVDVGEVEVQSIDLMKSTLTPQGAIYEVLSRYLLYKSWQNPYFFL